MTNELEIVNNKFISVMQEQSGVLGAWYFGSNTHDMSDEYSDIDIVFLIDEKYFKDIDADVTKLLGSACDNVILCWPEDFNGEAITNYGYILDYCGKVIQYDVFLINKGFADDFMCQLHYMNLQEKDIIFDKDDNVKLLIKNALSPEVNVWQEDIFYIIDTYWYHFYMSAKYFIRKDFFKLNNVLRTLMDKHMSLLLTLYDKTTWGGAANKLHFIDKDKQKHLMKYGCIEDFSVMRENLIKSVEWFESDVNELCGKEEIMYCQKVSEKVKHYWIENTNKIN